MVAEMQAIGEIYVVHSVADAKWSFICPRNQRQ